jgi:hypothetical protein
MSEEKRCLRCKNTMSIWKSTRATIPVHAREREHGCLYSSLLFISVSLSYARRVIARVHQRAPLTWARNSFPGCHWQRSSFAAACRVLIRVIFG